MTASQNSSRPAAEQDSKNILYAKQSLALVEPEDRIATVIIQQSYPNDPARGHDYARYILAEARFALDREKSIHKEQSTMNNENGKNGNSNNNGSKGNRNSDQYRRDWSYALRALEKGDAPEKVVKDMAAFRKDLSDPQKYAQATVAKAQQHLQIRDELGKAQTDQPKHQPDHAAVDKALLRISHVEYARHMYEDGANRETVTEALKHDRRLGKKESDSIARESETRFFAERDLNYAVRARERGEGDDRIIPAIAQYRQDKIQNPQEYARAIVAAADKVREAERQQPNTRSTQHEVAVAQQQYRRDLQFAAVQLEHRTPDQVQIALNERRPEKAYESRPLRIHYETASSYSAAVIEQANKIREITDRGRGLEETLDVAEREFGRHLQQALSQREAGQGYDQITKNLTERAGATKHYARAVFNQAYTIHEQQREISIRPEMAQEAMERAKPVHERAPARATASVER